MEKNNLSAGSYDVDQLEKYAKDLAEVYRSEKQKRQQVKASNKQLLKYADDLNRTISELKAANEELKRAFLDTIHRLALAAEYKDEGTGNHIMRMSRYSALIAEKVGLSAKDVKNILYAAPMHDLGKIGIPDSILLKAGKLTAEEFGIMKSHTIIGANLLAYSKSEILQVAEEIAISHHEKWNGRGYPQGLSGVKIPLVGRIVGLADTFDALTSKRPYKDPYPIDVALTNIKKERGEHFDPDVVDIFLDNIDGILKIKAEVDETIDLHPANFNYSERDLLEKR